jgi:hypothetical protein
MVDPTSAEQPSGHGAEPTALDRRLGAVGVPFEALDRAIRRGEEIARQATPLHPVMAAGTYRWMETVAVLRTELAGLGWKPNDVRNSPRIVSPDKTKAVMVTAGNFRTGLEGDPQPRSARPKGPATRRSIQVNGQLAFQWPGLEDLAGEAAQGVETWALLYFRRNPSDGEEGFIRAELSLPVEVNEQGSVLGWRDRIILPQIDLGPTVIVSDGDDEDGTDGVADFDVPFRQD